MPLPKFLGAYDDVKSILDTILSVGSESKYVLPDYNTAVRWRMRANKFRALYREQYGEPSPYDSMVFKLRKDANTVVIQLSAPVEGELELGSGEKVTPVLAPATAAGESSGNMAELAALAMLEEDEE